MDDISLLLTSMCVTFYVLTFTETCYSDHSNYFILLNYQYFFKNHNQQQGGRVAMYVRKSLQVTCIDEVSITTANYEATVLKNNCNIFCILHHPPIADISLFLSFVDQLFNFVCIHPYCLFMSGDLTSTCQLNLVIAMPF